MGEQSARRRREFVQDLYVCQQVHIVGKHDNQARFSMRRLSHGPWLPFSLGGAVALAFIIFVPYGYHPYVRVPGSTLRIALQCAPAAASIDVLTSYATPSEAILTLTDRGTGKPLANIPAKISGPSAGNAYSISIPSSYDGYLSKIASRDSTFDLMVLFTRTPYLDIRDISLTYEQNARADCRTHYSGDELYRITRIDSAEVMHYRLVQEWLSAIVVEFNDTVGNVLLGVMTIALVWFSYIFVETCRRLYFEPQQKLMQRLSRRISQAPEELRSLGITEIVAADFKVMNRRLIFAKTVGPAVGFLLTVSSLSAALDPAVQSAQDTFRFISAIQIAIIATFMGLAIRIVALFAQRVTRNLAERELYELERKQRGVP